MHGRVSVAGGRCAQSVCVCGWWCCCYTDDVVVMGEVAIMRCVRGWVFLQVVFRRCVLSGDLNCSF